MGHGLTLDRRNGQTGQGLTFDSTLEAGAYMA